MTVLISAVGHSSSQMDPAEFNVCIAGLGLNDIAKEYTRLSVVKLLASICHTAK